jgi:uncharacterized membrane protein YhaH (DUF805 family)
MQLPFAFTGTIRRLPYAFWSAAIFFSQHLLVLAIAAAYGQALPSDLWFYVNPLRSLVTLPRVSNIVLILALAYLLAAAWALAALAFRRAADADIGGGTAVFAIAPIAQIPVILFLCCMPSHAAQDRRPVAADAGPSDVAWAAAAQGMAAGIALTLFAVLIGAVFFRVYGFGLFVASPFVIGATTAYVANRKHDIGSSQTASVVLSATALGGIALIAAALEGVICIVMAAPLGLLVAWIGGLFGRAMAVSAQSSATQTLSGFALLPLLFAMENVLPATTSFDTHQTIAVRAPPDVVWKSIVHMETIDEPPSLPFRLGVAYPLRGEIIGEGVGALRRGEFSTGTAYERVTEWVAGRKLAFVVLNDVPAMHELSPYGHLHTPHLVGYFRTTSTSFELAVRSDGHTEVIERTSHELKLEPVLYWLPLARWVVHQNNARVLAHIRRQAERDVRPGD